MKHLRSFLAAVVGVALISTLAFSQSVPGVNSNLAQVWSLIWETSTLKPTYSASTRVTPASSATDVCALSGSATKNVRVRRVEVGTFGTATQLENVGIIKRSTAPSGGGTQPTITPLDSINLLTGATNSATAVVETWTANPTVGTIVGFVADPFLLFNPTASNIYSLLPADAGGSPIILRGVAESITVNLNGVTITGGSLTCRFEWTEE